MDSFGLVFCDALYKRWEVLARVGPGVWQSARCTEKNAEFYQINSLSSATSFRSCKLLAASPSKSLKYGKELFLDQVYICQSSWLNINGALRVCASIQTDTFIVHCNVCSCISG